MIDFLERRRPAASAFFICQIYKLDHRVLKWTLFVKRPH
jgi:hypothetical protein